MNLMEVLRIWRRHWLLTAAALLVALTGCGIAIVKIPKTYQAESTVVLIPSQRASNTLGDGNPYLSFTASLATTAAVAAAELTAPAAERSLAARGFDEPFTAVAESTAAQTVASGSVLPGPFIAVTVTGRSPELVESTLRGVTSGIGATMSAMQSGISRSRRISVSVLSATAWPTVSVSAEARSLVLTVGLLLVLALGTPLVADAQLRRWRRWRQRDSAQHRSPAQPAAGPLARKIGGRPT
jgi:hypothetical protein